MRIKLTKEDQELLRSVKEKLDNEFKEDFTNVELSKMFHIGDHKLRHGFKLLFGVSIRQYHESRRMEYALQLLQETSLTVTQVLFEVGYKETRTFYRAFKKVFHATPYEWKRKKVSIDRNTDKDLAFDKYQKGQ